MNCRKINAHLADLLFEPGSVPAEAQKHVKECAACAAELAALQATMNVMDEWRAPEPGAFFDAKLYARLRSEAAAPAGRWAQMRAWLLYSSRFPMRQWAAGVLTAVLAVGGGVLALIEHDQTPAIQTSATVRDLQSFDGNAQLFQQLNALDVSDDSSSNASN